MSIEASTADNETRVPCLLLFSFLRQFQCILREMGGCGGKCVRWEGVEGSVRDGRVWREEEDVEKFQYSNAPVPPAPPRPSSPSNR